jgi:hypothetical protein
MSGMCRGRPRAKACISHVKRLLPIDAPQNDRWVLLIFCIATPALHKPVPQLRQIFIKNIKPKFHFGQQLSSLVAVYEASITTPTVEG